MSGGAALWLQKLMPFPVGDLCFLLAVQDVALQPPAPATWAPSSRAVTFQNNLPPPTLLSLNWLSYSALITEIEKLRIHFRTFK